MVTLIFLSSKEMTSWELTDTQLPLSSNRRQTDLIEMNSF
jgi:hypothetical protein